MIGCLRTLRSEKTLRRKNKRSLKRSVLNSPDPYKLKEKPAHLPKKIYQLQGVSIKGWVNWLKDIRTGQNSVSLSIHRILIYYMQTPIENQKRLKKPYRFLSSKSKCSKRQTSCQRIWLNAPNQSAIKLKNI